MATGPEHYKEAERLIEIAAKLTQETVGYAKDSGVATPAEMSVMAAHSANFLVEAQVHATLALAAATVANNQMLGVEAAKARVEWQETVSDAR